MATKYPGNPHDSSREVKVTGGEEQPALDTVNHSQWPDVIASKAVEPKSFQKMCNVGLYIKFSCGGWWKGACVGVFEVRMHALVEKAITLLLPSATFNPLPSSRQFFYKPPSACQCISPEVYLKTVWGKDWAIISQYLTYRLLDLFFWSFNYLFILCIPGPFCLSLDF